jgi:hypothetical protein
VYILGLLGLLLEEAGVEDLIKFIWILINLVPHFIVSCCVEEIADVFDLVGYLIFLRVEFRNLNKFIYSIRDRSSSHPVGVGGGDDGTLLVIDWFLLLKSVRGLIHNSI